MNTNNKRIGLGLSGGCYRAAAFHLGTLQKLDELGILEKIDVMSTISGGSITGAAYCIQNGRYDAFHNDMVQKLSQKDVIKFIFGSWIFIRSIMLAGGITGLAICLTFTAYAVWSFPILILLFVLLLKYQFRIFPVSKVIEHSYDSFFYDGKTLKDLKKNKTELAIGSSNLHTGRPFTFSRRKMSDSDYSFMDPKVEFLHEDFPISRAVMASSCVPFAFTPVAIDLKYYKNQKDYSRVKPQLVDGGVYDNQGLQKLTQKGSSFACDVIITSDAGGNFKDDVVYPNTLQLLIRTVDLFMYRIKAFQMQQHVYGNTAKSGRPIAYISLGWRVENLISGFVKNMSEGKIIQEVLDAHGFEAAWISDPANNVVAIEDYLKERINYDIIKKNALTDDEWEVARKVGTNLKALPKEVIQLLIRQAATMTEIQIRLYCPMLLHKNP